MDGYFKNFKTYIFFALDLALQKSILTKFFLRTIFVSLFERNQVSQALLELFPAKRVFADAAFAPHIEKQKIIFN